MIFLPTENGRENNNNNNSIDDVLHMFDPYMLTVDKLVATNQARTNTPNRPITVTNTDNVLEKTNDVSIDRCISNEPPEAELTTISPTQPDSLFWCIYIAIHSYDDFLMIRNKHDAIEMEWKHKLSKQITECPAKIKQSNCKITKANIQEILSDFMTSPCKTNLLCVVAITVYHNIHIIIMNATNNMRMEFTTENDAVNTYIIYKNDRNHYRVCNEPLSKENLACIRSSSFLIENNEKPLKSVGSYKMDQLVEYANMFGVHCANEKCKKNELYEAIGHYIAKYNITI
jgi:hypothetical protein